MESPKIIFQSLKSKAKSVVEDRAALMFLIRSAQEKLSSQKEKFHSSYEDMSALLRLLKQWSSGHYRNISYKSILVIVCAILYFFNPFDLIPDFLATFGFLDDITVLSFAIQAVKDELVQFLSWEKNQAESAD